MIHLTKTPRQGSGVAEVMVQRSAAIRHLQQTGATRAEAVAAVDEHYNGQAARFTLLLAAFADGADRAPRLRPLRSRCGDLVWHVCEHDEGHTGDHGDADHEWPAGSSDGRRGRGGPRR